MKLPPYPDNPTTLQKAYHDYIRGKIPYGAYCRILDANIDKWLKESRPDVPAIRLKGMPHA